MSRAQSRRPQVEIRAVPQEVHDFQPDTPLTVYRKVFLQCLKTASRGASSHEGIDEHQIDSSHEAGWWNPWHCDRMCAQKIGCHYLGTAVHEGVRVRMRSISVCPLQQEPGHFSASCGMILCMDGIGTCNHVLRSTLLERDSSTCPQPRPCCPVFDCPAVAIETGGRWSSEAVDFVRQLAFAKAREVPSFVQFLHSPRLGPTPDADAVDCLLSVICSLSGGTL